MLDIDRDCDMTIRSGIVDHLGLNLAKGLISTYDLSCDKVSDDQQYWSGFHNHGVHGSCT